jgi:glucosylceramidase
MIPTPGCGLVSQSVAVGEMMNEVLTHWARVFWLLLFLSLPLPSHGAAAEGRVHGVVSSLAGERLRTIPPVEFGAEPAPGLPVISIDPKERFQTMQGFGATFTEAGLLNLNKLPRQRQERVLQSLFDSKRGAGFTLMKSPMAAFDFASAGAWYSYDDVAGDIELKHFSIARDLGPNGLVTFIKQARRYGSFQLQSTMDYPPDWMLDAKTNVRPECYPALAQYYLKYLRAYQAEGVMIDFLSPFNEPHYIYCKISYPEIRDFIKWHLGPALRGAGLTTKLQTCDSHQRGEAVRDFPVLLDDPEVRQYISVMSLHGYKWKAQGSSAMRQLHERYPGLAVWQSEVCHTASNLKRPMPLYEFEDGEFWGRMIIADLQNWAAGWIYWNMILDERGGPWLVSLAHENSENNSQHPVVIVNTETKRVFYTGLYYYLTHFSRFVRPGAVRIAAAGSVTETESVAFSGPDGERVLVILNSCAARRPFVLKDGSRFALLGVPAHGIATFVWK